MRISELEEKIVELFKLPLWYDDYGQIIWDNKNQMVADVRAWGMLQYEDEGAKLQAQLGRMLCDAFNEKYYKEVAK